jgi:hypothetical protein
MLATQQRGNEHLGILSCTGNCWRRWFFWWWRECSGRGTRELFVSIDMSPCAHVCRHSNKSIPHAAPRGSLQLIDMNVYSGPRFVTICMLNVYALTMTTLTCDKTTWWMLGILISMSYFKTKKMNLSSMKRWPHTAFRFALSPVMSMAECA